MKQPLSKGALRTRALFFTALRTMSLRDMTTARVARRVEHEINEVLMQIERFAATHSRASARSSKSSGRIAAKWLELAVDCVEVDADLADVVTLFARQWLQHAVPPERAQKWVQRAECVIRLLSIRGEKRHDHGIPDVRAIENEEPMVTLVLRGLPRAAQPVDVEVDLGDGAVIGRADECDWMLPGEVVSRHHAKLRYDPGLRTFFVSNLSRNGLGIDDEQTLLDGEVPINVGTTLRIPKEGHYRILVQSVFVPLNNLLYEGRTDNTDIVNFEDELEGTRDSVALLPVEPHVFEWSDLLGDPHGVVQHIYSQYSFLPTSAAPIVRDYVYGDIDAMKLIDAVFTDLHGGH